MSDTLTPRLPLPAPILESYDQLKVDVVLLELDSISAIRFSGDDRKGWLQGQVTNNLRSFDAGSAVSFCLCESTGHLQAVCDAWAFPDFILATMESVCAPAVLKRVESMVILENVVAEDVTPEYSLLSIQGPCATQALGMLCDLPTLDAGTIQIEGAEGLVLRSNRTGMGGWDVLLPREAQSVIAKVRETFAPLHPDAYEIARLEAGIPRFGKDWTHRTLPPELGPAFDARHVSYNKGCYMGQEVLMRIHSRGHTNRTWRALLSETPMQPGDAIGHSSRPDAGTVTSSVYSPDYGYLAAAMLRNEAAFPRERVTVATPDGVADAEVRSIPVLSLE